MDLFKASIFISICCFPGIPSSALSVQLKQTTKNKKNQQLRINRFLHCHTLSLIYFQILPGGKLRKFGMGLSLIPKTGRRYIGFLGQIPSSMTPTQVLNGYAQILFKTNGIHDMPPIKSKTLSCFIRQISGYYLHKSAVRGSKGDIFSIVIRHFFRKGIGQ